MPITKLWAGIIVRQTKLGSLHAKRVLLTVLFLYHVFNGGNNCSSLLKQLYFRFPHLNSTLDPAFSLRPWRTIVIRRSPIYLPSTQAHYLKGEHTAFSMLRLPFWSKGRAFASGTYNWLQSYGQFEYTKPILSFW